jgi:hypothetical protein
MNFEIIITAITSFIVSGGLSILLTIKFTRRKSNAESGQIIWAAAKDAFETQVKYIIDPLKREITKLRRAIERVDTCPYKNQCPVISEINNIEVEQDLYESDNQKS